MKMSLRLFLEGSLRSEYIIAYSICVVCKARTGGIRWLRVTYFLKGVTQTITYCHREEGGSQKLAKRRHVFCEWPLKSDCDFHFRVYVKVKI